MAAVCVQDMSHAGGLSQLERTVDATNPKMHLAVNDMQRKIEAALSVRSRSASARR
jgi:hypothetical protein